MSDHDFINVKQLHKRFIKKKGLLKPAEPTVYAVNGVSFSICKGEVFGLVGESGSGKSTVGKCVVGLYPPSEGSISFDGNEIAGNVDARSAELRQKIQMVFQDPTSSLNPKKTVRKIVGLPIDMYEPRITSAERSRRVEELLEMVEIPVSYIDSLPRSLSGGQRQRVAIARALACNPQFLVLDEPTSALDVSVQAKIIKILDRLRDEFNLSYLFITHDLSLVRNIATRTAVMYLGKLVEQGPTGDLFTNPRHPYTQTLLSAIYVVSEEENALKPSSDEVEGEIPSPTDIPSGCSFHARCPQAMDVCAHSTPEGIEYEQGHWVRCHLYTNGGSQ